MRLSFGQHMQMAQKQILAPRMIQSMEILQLPIMALQERIDKEMQENPCLEMQEMDPDLPDGEYPAAENPNEKTLQEKELVVDGKDGADDFDRLVEMSADWQDHFETGSKPSSSRMEEEADRQHDALANMVSRPATLHDHLCQQLSWYELEEELRAMVERVIYNLDTNGYLTTSLADLLPPDAPPEQLTLAQQALAVVQKLDPPGVGARDLRECLLLQLKPGMPYYEQLRTLISGHLEDLRDNRLPAIQRKCGYSLETIQETLDELRQLKPKPGAEFNSQFVPNVTPDVFLDADDSGKYKVRIEDTQLPNLYISNYHRQLLSSPDTPPEIKDWVKRKVNSAQWLIESIEQRRNTLTKVAQAIVDHQTAFLDKGPEFIEPLKMQQIADKVGVHVTTVSRAVDDKWIQTPRGLFPLKRFFGGGTVSADGEEVAWDAVRLKLQEVIDQEDKKSPLSDDELVGELKKHGLTVARRTVTKYRKAMNIPSSRQRRDWSLSQDDKSAGNGHSPASHTPASHTPANRLPEAHLPEARHESVPSSNGSNGYSSNGAASGVSNSAPSIAPLGHGVASSNPSPAAVPDAGPDAGDDEDAAEDGE